MLLGWRTPLGCSGGGIVGVITPTVRGPGRGSQSRHPYRGVVPAPLPAPMLATATKEPPRGDDWAYEMKWDGYRAIVEVHDGQLRIARAAAST